MQKTKEQEIKELKTLIRLMKEKRTEQNRPTLWIDKEQEWVEIHFKNKTLICKVNTIDTETSRENSDCMAQGSGFKELIYKTQGVKQ